MALIARNMNISKHTISSLNKVCEISGWVILLKTRGFRFKRLAQSFGVIRLESRQPTVYFSLKRLHRCVNVVRTCDAGEVEFQNKISSRLNCAIFDSSVHVEILFSIRDVSTQMWH